MPETQRNWEYMRRMTEQLMNIWMTMPGQRLGQLLDNAVGRYGPGAGQRGGGPDMFNIEDGDLSIALVKFRDEFAPKDEKSWVKNGM